MSLFEILNFKISRKYSFSIVVMLIIIGVLFVINYLKFPEKVAMVAIIATDLPILVIAIAYLTGQAKIELQALYGRAPSTEITTSNVRGSSSPPPPPPGREGGL